MLSLRLSTFLTPLTVGPLALFGMPGAAQAATTVSSSTTTPLATSGSGDVTVASGGTITVTGQPAVTVDSGNAVTIASGGTLASSPGNNGGGILVNPGTTSTVSNAGAITVSENYTVDSITGTTTASGPIANTTGRFGISVAGAASGSVTNSGSIAVKGLNGLGIGLAGLYSGSLTNTGTVTVKGEGGVGIGFGAITGDVQIGGTVGVVGGGSQAVLSTGDVGGAFVLSGGLSQVASYTTDSSTTQYIAANLVKAGKALVEIDGNLAKGLVLFAPCTPTTVNSIASCTATNSAITTAGSLSAIGNNPAIQLGGATNVTIGAGAASIDGNTYSVALDGSIAANAGYSATDASGVVVGGRGGTVSLPGGIGVAGTVSATAVDGTAAAILINPGASVATLNNTGVIKATLSQAGGTAAYGIRDLSGTLGTVTNHGTISATAGLTSVAVDLSARSSGATYVQSLTPYQTAQQQAEQALSTYNAATATVYTSTIGDIVTGSGNDLLDIRSGTVTGNAWLGGGTDSVALSGDARWTGNINDPSGAVTITLAGSSRFTGALSLANLPATLTLAGTSVFTGTGLTGGSQLDVTVNGGGFGASSGTTLAVRSLTVGSGGTLNAVIDGASGTSSLISATTATFASGAKVAATISSLANSSGTYRILTAGALVGTPVFTDSTTVLPLLFKGSVAAQGNDLYLTISRKSATDLGLSRSETAGYDAIYANAAANTALANSLLQASSLSALQGQFDQLLPDHSGAIFDFLTRGSRLASRHLADDASIYSISPVSGWLEPLYFRGSKAASGTPAWTDSGFGLSMGLEQTTGLGNLGVSFAWFGGNVRDGSWQTVKANSYELGGFWRVSRGPFYAFAKLGADRVTAGSTRVFSGTVNGSALSYTAIGRWSGWAVTSSGGASYKLDLPGHLSLKPMAILEYARLHENGYQESNAAAIALAVNARTSQSLTARTTLTAGWSAGPVSHDGRPLMIELEGGRRSQMSGSLGTTTASFSGGTPFSLTPDTLKGGWLGEARMTFGGFDYTWQLAGAAEKILGRTDYSLRAGLSMAF